MKIDGLAFHAHGPLEPNESRDRYRPRCVDIEGDGGCSALALTAGRPAAAVVLVRALLFHRRGAVQGARISGGLTRAVMCRRRAVRCHRGGCNGKLKTQRQLKGEEREQDPHGCQVPHPRSLLKPPPVMQMAFLSWADANAVMC